LPTDRSNDRSRVDAADGPAAASDVLPPAEGAWRGRLRTLVRRLMAFGVVGFIGFVVDMAATLALMAVGADKLSARAVGIVIAMAVTYGLNRSLTFRDRASGGGRAEVAEGARYGVVAIGTSALNWAVYAGVLWLMPTLPPVIAIAIGSGTAMAASYVGYARFAFRG